ncbi:MAG: alpha/beta fold hydrolase [Candidatus Alcyoniella australis]|nr:alpha/beta fold hydrolase [Candidatus Alcyoniella australis]
MRQIRTSMIVALLTVAMLAAGCTVYSPIQRVYRLEQVQSERVATSDGVQVALTTYAPSGRSRGTALLLPDLFSTSLVFDLDAEHSLARHLVRRGWTVVTLDWRGCGRSDRPDWHNGEPYTWTVGQMLQYDLPAAVAHARAKGSGPLVVWAHGHAGVIALGALELDPKLGVDAMVALGVPGRHYDYNLIQQALAAQADRLDPFNGVDCAAAAGLRAPFKGETQSVADILLFNDELFQPQVKAEFVRSGFTVQSVLVADSVIRWWSKGELIVELDQDALNVGARLGEVSVPTYIAAGKLDNWVTPGESIALHDGLGSQQKLLRVFSQANGYRDNYGHMGLLLGPNARDEVWDAALRWLDELEL